jgi:hypothetical protein
MREIQLDVPFGSSLMWLVLVAGDVKLLGFSLLRVSDVLRVSL